MWPIQPFLDRKEKADAPLGVSSEASEVCDGAGDSGSGAELLMNENPEDEDALVEAGGGTVGCVARTASAAVPLRVMPPKSDIFMYIIMKIIKLQRAIHLYHDSAYIGS